MNTHPTTHTAATLAAGPLTPAGVRRYLDASTAHMTHSDARALESGAVDILHETHAAGAGWWVHVGENAAEQAERIEAEGLSPAFAGVIAHARALGCNWVLFDAAADTLPALPVFTW